MSFVAARALSDLGATRIKGPTEPAGQVAREFGVRLPDAVIAATALEHGLGLVTRNLKHFNTVRGLRIRSIQCTAPGSSVLGAR
ncbi:MAG: PIN domain-containing protein [Ilumatobacteraceae bacterium]